MDAIILLNDNYIHYNLKSGFIGVVVDNFIKTRGFVLADFFHPFTRPRPLRRRTHSRTP